MERAEWRTIKQFSKYGNMFVSLIKFFFREKELRMWFSGLALALHV